MARYARKSQPGRLLTENKVRERARQTMQKIPTDSFGFTVIARKEGHHNTYAWKNIRSHAEMLFKKVYPQQADYAYAYGIGLDGTYGTTQEDSNPVLEATPFNPDRKEQTGLWYSKQSVEQKGLKFSIWAKAYDLGRKDGVALKKYHLAYRKTGRFGPVKTSSVLEKGRTLEAAESDRTDLYLQAMAVVKPKKWQPPETLPQYDTCVIESIAYIIDKTPQEIWQVARPFWLKRGGINQGGQSAILKHFGYTARLRSDLSFIRKPDKTFGGTKMDNPRLAYIAKTIGSQKDALLLIHTKGHLIGCKDGKILDVGDTDPRSKVYSIYQAMTKQQEQEFDKKQQEQLKKFWPIKASDDPIDYYEYGYWILNNGDLEIVPQERHVQVARRWLEKNYPATVDHLRDKDSYLNPYKAYDYVEGKLGWIRIRNMGSECGINFSQAATLTLECRRTLKRYLENSPFETFTVGMMSRDHKNISKTFTDPQRVMNYIYKNMQRDLTAMIEQVESALKPQEITAGVSFLSVKDISKRYPQFLKNVTLGFECEVASGSFVQEREPEPVDDDIITREFENQFRYSEYDYIQQLDREGENAFQKYNCKLRKPLVTKKDLKPLAILWRDLKKYGFPVLQYKDGTVRSPDKSFEPYEDHDELNPYNWTIVITEAKKVYAFMNKISKIFVIPTSYGSGKSFYIISKTKVFEQIINNAKTKSKNSPEDQHYIVWRLNTIIEEFLDNVKSFLIAIINQPANPPFPQYIYVKTKGKIATVDTENAFIFSSGVGTDFVDLSKEDQARFEEDYEAARDEEYREQLLQYRENYEPPNNELTDEDHLNQIHDAVVDYVDKSAHMSTSYHDSDDTEEYKGKVTVVEPDSSISPNGAEIVSPILRGTDKGFAWLDKVFDMIDQTGMETNRSTGMHVNIGSFQMMDGRPQTSRIPTIDVVKLALLSGDEYLLRQFGRQFSKYAQSLKSNLEHLKESGFIFDAAMKTDIKNSLVKINKAFVENQSNRYRTFNFQNLEDKNYIEVRVPGGEDYHKDRAKIKRAVYRYIQLCAIACDQDAHFTDYMKALYKLLVKKEPSLPGIGDAPRPRTADQAIYVLKTFNRTFSQNGYPFNSRNIYTLEHDIDSNEYFTPMQVIDIMSDLEPHFYNKVDANVLYAIRRLMLESAKNKPDPKQWLRKEYEKVLPDLKKNLAHDLMRFKPQWVQFFYTGTGLQKQPLEAEDTMDRELLANLQDRMVNLHAEAESQSYTNKTKNTMLIFYKNRSTPQVARPGQTVHSKAGYGKRTSTRKATPEQIALMKKGGWVRTRESKHEPGEKGAKKSKYRSWLNK